MAGLIAPGICRFTVNGTYAGRQIANILDMEIDTTGSTMSRLDAIEDQAAVIVSEWADRILDILVDDYTATSVSWLDLDDDTGTVGEVTVGTGTDFPASGALDVPAMPGNVAFRVEKAITAARGQRQGRMYLVGVPEGATTNPLPNTVIDATITAANTMLTGFLDAINQEGDATSYDSHLVVIHTSSEDNPEPPPQKLITFEGFGRVTGLTLDETLASQRRRLRG